MIGAGIVALAVLLGMAVGARNGLDGAQTAMACLLAWLILASLRNGAESAAHFLGRRGRRR